MEERGGFEPPVVVTHYAGLANLCLQPLGHLSTRTRIWRIGGVTRQWQRTGHR